MRDLSHIRNVVFEGGSVKGIAYLGAIEALLEHGFTLGQLRNVAGTSAGAICASLLAVGHEIEYIRELLQSTSFEHFLDGHDRLRGTLFAARAVPRTPADDDPGAGGIFGSVKKTCLASMTLSALTAQMIKQHGVFKGEFFRQWIEHQIKLRAGIDYLTFGELHELATREPDRYRSLSVVVYNISLGRTEILNHETHSEMIVSDAVRASMSIPFLFKPHNLHVKIDGIRTRIPDASYVDGGTTLNYPVQIYDPHVRPGGGGESKDEGEYCRETLGFRLMSSEQVRYHHGREVPRPNDITNSVAYGKEVVRAMMNLQHEQFRMGGEAARGRTIIIDTVGVGTLDFNLSGVDQERLIESGRRSALDFASSRVRAPGLGRGV